MSITQDNHIFIKNTLTNFRQYSYEEDSRHNAYLIGEIVNSDPVCPRCGRKAQINDYTVVRIKHFTFGNKLTTIKLKRCQYGCPHCNYHFQDKVPFKAQKHFITKQLQEYIEDLLALHMFTITAIYKLTSVHPTIIKDIDKHRLKQKYVSVYNVDGDGDDGNTSDGVKYCYRTPNHLVKHLGIDEFSLHRHHKYATVIMDLETGEILFVAIGRKKQVVYDFIKVANNVYSTELGEDFMQHIEAVSSDMNSDYEEAFMEKYPHLKVVYDHFHVVKNFNEHVINPIRKDEYARLWKEGKWREADNLKNSKYLLIADYDSLNEKGQTKVSRILEQNKLLLLADIVKEQLRQAYQADTAFTMLEYVCGIIELCIESQNKHFLWFAKLLEEHLDGIIMHGAYQISTGRVEGTNNKIKTTRRQAYGFHDDEYFFLKILDMTIEK